MPHRLHPHRSQWWLSRQARRRWRRLLVGGSGLCLFLALHLAMAQSWRNQVRVIETLPAGEVNWTEGLALSRERVTSSVVQDPAAAQSAAVQAARQRLLSVLRQLRLDAARTLGQVMQETPALQHNLAALVAEAEVYENRYFPRSTVESAVQLSLVGRFLELLLPPSTPLTPSDNAEPVAVYTGVVIDARGLAIQPALLPRIVDDSGTIVYAPEQVDPVIAVQRGYVAYAQAFDQEPAQVRIGAHPLVLRARRVEGASRVDLVLRHSDAAQLRDYAAIQRLLQRCQVLIVM